MQGKIINGYTVIEFIGKGQFGTVYKCQKDQNIYAIKIFNLEFVFDEFRMHGDDNRITREIAALKIVNHENVIKLIDEGVFEDNSQLYVYMVMECLHGVDLKDYLSKRELSFEETIDIFKQILEGLDAVHRSNIVHRDLKPQNIFITDDGKVKLLDFGLAKLIDFTSITSTGSNIGSPIYMSPEQVKDSKNIDYRSDYYALGIILFEMLTKDNPYGEIVSKEQMFYKIIHEIPISVLQFVPLTPNCVDNLIFELLKKMNYQRPNNKEEILRYLNLLQVESKDSCDINKHFVPSFYMRVWNEKSVLESYYEDGYQVENIVFPINHQSIQKGLLNHIKNNGINFIVDPSTLRLAYDTFADVKGLLGLPYAPQDYTRLDLDNFSELGAKKQYVKLVVDEQLKHNPSCIVSPFHYNKQLDLLTIKNSKAETWFSLDVKLLKETKDYLQTNGIDKKLVCGFCIKADILTNRAEKEYFLNVLSGLPCDTYWIYVDCIDYNSNASQIYQYISTLLELQKSTNKPIIAGRVGTIGLVLLAFGLYAFESGAARFETFYEDLYKETTENYNMYVMYYVPELMKNIAVERKNPSKIINILKAKSGIDLKCKCPYCEGKQPDELITESITRKHFLYRRHEEITLLRSLSIPKRLDYLEARIKKAISYYRDLAPVFKDNDYNFLRTWQKVIADLRKICEL